MLPYKKISKIFQESLKPVLPPIAICITKNIPEGVPNFKGSAPAGCVFWQEAAKGPIATLTKDHEMCAIGVHTHNLANPSGSYKKNLGTLLEIMDSLHHVKKEDLLQIPVLEQETKVVVYSPLSETPLLPDVVLIFVNSRQGLVIAEAVQQLETAVPPVLGRPACAIVPQVINNDQAALSLGCCGARAYLDTFSDDITLWALPGKKLMHYADRIMNLTKANETLTVFHSIRRRDVEAGLEPTIVESLSQTKI